MGLVALLLLHEARRLARTTETGDMVLLADQDRSLWDRFQIAEASTLVERALHSRRFGPYTLQAAIAAVHAEAPDAVITDWPQIVGLFRRVGRREDRIFTFDRCRAAGAGPDHLPRRSVAIEHLDAPSQRAPRVEPHAGRLPRVKPTSSRNEGQYVAPTGLRVIVKSCDRAGG
jgi:hypothetical protein